MHAIEIYKCDLTELTKEVMTADGKLIIKPSRFWKEREGRDDNEIRYFMHQYGIYVMPTTELIDWLRENIIGSAIEIGAGNGAISRALSVPITDSRMQERAEIKFMYQLSGQPVIEYPKDVEKLDAIEAINKYKPETVIGAFITHKYDASIGEGNAWGVEEEILLKRVKRYINIGNKITHKKKPILKLPHEEYQFDWLVTRAVNQNENVIFVFNQ
jgi:hypothetical protein